MNMKMDVRVKYPGETIEGDDPCYIVARNGVMFRVKQDWVKAVVPAEELIALAPEAPYAELLVSPIPAVMMAKIILFFHHVYLVHRTEVGVLLHYSSERGWAFSVPSQDISHEHVFYDMTERVPSFKCIGTVHSHGSFGAHHSLTDIKDEKEFDGIHITIGSFNSYPILTISPEIVIRGARFPLPLAHMGGITKYDDNVQVPWWLGGQAPALPHGFVPSLEAEYRTTRYTFDPKVAPDFKVPEAWMNNLRKVPLRESKRRARSLWNPGAPDTAMPHLAAREPSPKLPFSLDDQKLPENGK